MNRLPSLLLVFLLFATSCKSEFSNPINPKDDIEKVYHQLSESQKSALTSDYAQSQTKYRSVYKTNGIKLVAKQVSPASENEEQYFRELSLAYLCDTTKYYPFDYYELERFDPAGFSLMDEVWKGEEPQPNPNGVTLPPVSLTQWLKYKESALDLYYNKYLDCDGLPILSSRFVSDEALIQARYIAQTMLSRIPEAREAMIKAHFRIGVVGKDENITDMPECRDWNTMWPDTDWDERGRGYGATEYIPLMTIGEENLIKVGKDRYAYESIMVHEFGHNMEYGLANSTPGFSTKLTAVYNHAMDTGLWKSTYSATNESEYFAEGVQAWFDTCNMYVSINGRQTRIQTRTQLKEYDSQLYDLIASVMPEDKLTGYHFN